MTVLRIVPYRDAQGAGREIAMFMSIRLLIVMTSVVDVIARGRIIRQRRIVSRGVKVVMQRIQQTMQEAQPVTRHVQLVMS